MSRTQECVNNLFDVLHSREQKVNRKIIEFENEIQDTESRIGELTNMLISMEVECNEKGQEQINSEIVALKEKQADLTSNISQYKNALNDSSYIKAELPKIFDACREDQVERLKKLSEARDKKDNFEKEIQNIQNNLNRLDFEIANLSYNDEIKQLIPLIRYIEPRKIKRMFEEPYLKALMEGAPRSVLDQYIENVDNEGQHQPEDCCIMTEYHPSDEEIKKAVEANRMAQASYK